MAKWVTAGLLVLGLFGVAAVVQNSFSQLGLVLFSQSKKENVAPCTVTQKKREFASAPYYSGSLIDAHVHMPVSSKFVSTVAGRAGFKDMPVLGEKLTMEYLNCLFESEGIRKVFGFYVIPRFVDSGAVAAVQKFEEKYPGRIVPFFMPPPIHFLMTSSARTKELLTKSGTLFRGVGEIAFEEGNFTESSPEDDEFMSLFDIASARGLIVMMHPRPDQRSDVERILKKYPRVIFLLHGGSGNAQWITDVMDVYPNVYYSIDANMTSIYGFERNDNYGPNSKDEFLKKFRDQFNRKVDKALEEWKYKIEKYPDRFLWGTDRWYSWHFDAEVGGLLEEFGRSFIGWLDSAVQERFAFRNAERLLDARGASSTPALYKNPLR